jgi:hypothetical protein
MRNLETGQLLGKVQEKVTNVVRQQHGLWMSFKGVEGNDSIAWRLRQAYHDELLHSEALNDTTDSRLDLMMMIEETLAKIMYMAHQSTKDTKSILVNGLAWQLHFC